MEWRQKEGEGERKYKGMEGGRQGREKDIEEVRNKKGGQGELVGRIKGDWKDTGRKRENKRDRVIGRKR